MLSLKDYVVSASNEEAFELVKNINKEAPAPIQIVLVGPKGCGKTSLLQHRKADWDLLSSKKILVRSAEELATTIRLNAPDSFYESLGSSEVLFIDDFHSFLQEGEIGEMFPRLLLRERNAQKLDTILVVDEQQLSNVFDSYKDVLSDFTCVKMRKLDAETRKRVLAQQLAKLKAEQASISEHFLSKETPKLLTEEQALSLKSMLRIAEFLIKNQQDFTDEKEELDEVRKLLKLEAN